MAIVPHSHCPTLTSLYAFKAVDGVSYTFLLPNDTGGVSFPGTSAAAPKAAAVAPSKPEVDANSGVQHTPSSCFRSQRGLILIL